MLERRRQLDQDLLDEMWEGVYVMNPGPSSGHADIQAQVLWLPQERKVDWLSLQPDGRYEPIERSSLVELSAAELGAGLDWPD